MARIQQKKAGKRVRRDVDAQEMRRLCLDWERRNGLDRENRFNRHPGGEKRERKEG